MIVAYPHATLSLEASVWCLNRDPRAERFACLENEVVEIQRCRAGEVVGSSPTERAIRFKHLRDPLLQLERPRQTEHQRLGDIVSGVFTPVFTKTAQRRGTVEQGPHGKVTVGQAIATTEAGE